MRRSTGIPAAAILIISMLLFTGTGQAATEYATFASFYKDSMSPAFWVASAVVAVVFAVGAILLSGGTASPAVAAIGTWIGNLMGYSGIAATNAGLALLGGGSIASGGTGIVGGAALLTAALTFGTDIVISYGTDKVLAEYNYSKFAEVSKEMTSLPLPKNSTGPSSYKAAIKILDAGDAEAPVNSVATQELILRAIDVLEANKDADATDADRLREQTLLSLLRFQQNDYAAAKVASNKAYSLARQLDQRATLPAFIYATASLYDAKPESDTILGYFAYAVTNEQDTALRQLLFAIFLDRAMYRMDDGGVDAHILEQLYDLSRAFVHDKRKAAVQVGLLSRYFIRIKVEQQKVSSLCNSNSKTIRDNPRTLDVVKRSLSSYKKLLATSRPLIDDQTNVLLAKEQERWSVPEWESQWLEKTRGADQLWQSYSAGTTALESMVRELEIYQQSLTQKSGSASVSQEAAAEDESPAMIFWLLALTVIVIGVVLRAFVRRKLR